MRTAKLKLVAAAAVGLIGTGAIVAVGQERKPADAGKPDSEWNKDLGRLKKPEVPEHVQGRLKEEERTRHLLPPVRPTAFPDIKPYGLKEVMEFAAKQVPPVLESDPLLRKLQKAKLQAALNEIVQKMIGWSGPHLGPPPPPSEATVPEFLKAVREAVATGLELSDRPEDRRVWLEFGVGVCKDMDGTLAERVKAGIESRSMAWLARRYRLDAEIALLMHIEQDGKRAK